jgi:hypothetical protein
VLFELGPSRRAVESVWTEELSTALVRFLLSLPQGFRAYAKRELHRRIDGWDRHVLPAPEATPELWDAMIATKGEVR